MSCKKSVLLTIAGLVAAVSASIVIAGGYEDPQPDWMLTQQQPAVTAFQPNVYFGGSLGWAWSDWNEFGFPKYITDLFLAPASGFSASTSGVNWGLLTGLQFTPHFAVEIGGYDLFDGNRELQTPPGTQVIQQTFEDDANSYFVYGALKAIVPLNQRFDIYAKLGPMYRHVGHNSDCTITISGQSTDCTSNPIDISDGHYVAFIFGAGLEYNITQNVMAGLQWYYVPSNDTDKDVNDFYPDEAPAVNAVIGTLSYRILNI